MSCGADYDKLYSDNWRLIRYIARRYYAACQRDRAVSVEDLEQVGFFGIVRAAETFNEADGYSWGHWAARAIIREIHKALGIRYDSDGRHVKAHTGAVSLDAPVSADDPDGPTILDTLADPDLPDVDEGLLVTDLQRCVREAVASLKDDRQRDLIQRCALEGKTQSGEAARLGISSERVRQLIYKGQQQLQRDERLTALYELELRTPYHHRRSVSTFFSTQTSDTEAAALWHMQRVDALDQRKAKREALLNLYAGLSQKTDRPDGQEGKANE